MAYNHEVEYDSVYDHGRVDALHALRHVPLHGEISRAKRVGMIQKQTADIVNQTLLMERNESRADLIKKFRTEYTENQRLMNALPAGGARNEQYAYMASFDNLYGDLIAAASPTPTNESTDMKRNDYLNFKKIIDNNVLSAPLLNLVIRDFNLAKSVRGLDRITVDYIIEHTYDGTLKPLGTPINADDFLFRFYEYVLPVLREMDLPGFQVNTARNNISTVGKSEILNYIIERRVVAAEVESIDVSATLFDRLNDRKLKKYVNSYVSHDGETPFSDIKMSDLDSLNNAEKLIDSLEFGDALTLIQILERHIIPHNNKLTFLRAVANRKMDAEIAGKYDIEKATPQDIMRSVRDISDTVSRDASLAVEPKKVVDKELLMNYKKQLSKQKEDYKLKIEELNNDPVKNKEAIVQLRRNYYDQRRLLVRTANENGLLKTGSFGAHILSRVAMPRHALRSGITQVVDSSIVRGTGRVASLIGRTSLWSASLPVSTLFAITSFVRKDLLFEKADAGRHFKFSDGYSKIYGTDKTNGAGIIGRHSKIWEKRDKDRLRRGKETETLKANMVASMLKRNPSPQQIEDAADMVDDYIAIHGLNWENLESAWADVNRKIEAMDDVIGRLESAHKTAVEHEKDAHNAAADAIAATRLGDGNYSANYVANINTQIAAIPLPPTPADAIRLAKLNDHLTLLNAWETAHRNLVTANTRLTTQRSHRRSLETKRNQIRSRYIPKNT